MAIVVVSFDGYSDLWDDFFGLLNKFWYDRKYPTYLVNNNLNPNYDNINVINCGDGLQWSSRTRIALEKIKEPYICLLLEDLFIGDYIINSDIDEIMQFVTLNNIEYYKLNSFSKISTNTVLGKDYLHYIPENLDYGVSLQAAIWKKSFLLRLLGDKDYNAWQFENDRLKESRNKPSRYVKSWVYDNRNILNIHHGVVQGKFLPDTIKYFESINYKLNTKDRGILSNKDLYIYILKRYVSNHSPNFLKSLLRTIGKKVGIRFVSQR